MRGRVVRSRVACLMKKMSCDILILFRAGYGTSEQQETSLFSDQMVKLESQMVFVYCALLALLCLFMLIVLVSKHLEGTC